MLQVLALIGTVAIYWGACNVPPPIKVALMVLAVGEAPWPAMVSALAVWLTAAKPGAATVVLEGNIGSGKSHVLRALGHGVPEDVAAWQPYLDWEDTSPGAAVATQLRILSAYIGARPGLQERSWCSVLMFSAYRLRGHDQRFFGAIALAVAALVRTGSLVLPRAVIHVQCSAEVCAERVATRKQPGDDVVTSAQLAELAEMDAALIAFYREAGVPVVPLLGTAGTAKCDDAYNAARYAIGQPCSTDDLCSLVSTHWKDGDKKSR